MAVIFSVNPLSWNTDMSNHDERLAMFLANVLYILICLC